MSKFRDPIYLVSDQYKDSGNLNVRIQLHERYSINPYGWFRWVLDQIELPAAAGILEVGCGSGKLWTENLHRLPSNWKIILSDFSPGMLLDCADKLPDVLHQFSFTVSSALAIPFPSAMFEAVIANHMLYHIAERPQALAEIARVLKPGGYLYAATNGENHLIELDKMIKRNYASSEGILPGKPSRDFCLENGAKQLAPWFSCVERRDYLDALIVTDPEPLLEYIFSMIPSTKKQESHSSHQKLERYIIGELGRKGCIRIQKLSGIFIAKK